MTIRTIVVGAGGFARELLDTICALNAYQPLNQITVLGVVDPNPSRINLERLRRRNVSYLGTDRDWIASAERDIRYIIGIGDPAIKERLASEYDAAGFEAMSVVHPLAAIGSEMNIGSGVVVCAGATISTNVRLNDHAHINPNATVGHDAIIGSSSSINPSATISGEVTVGARVLVGAGATVLENLDIGDDAVVGAMACVVRDVMARAVVKGIPAR